MLVPWRRSRRQLMPWKRFRQQHTQTLIWCSSEGLNESTSGCVQPAGPHRRRHKGRNRSESESEFRISNARGRTDAEGGGTRAAGGAGPTDDVSEARRRDGGMTRAFALERVVRQAGPTV